MQVTNVTVLYVTGYRILHACCVKLVLHLALCDSSSLFHTQPCLHQILFHSVVYRGLTSSHHYGHYTWLYIILLDSTQLYSTSNTIYLTLICYSTLPFLIDDCTGLYFTLPTSNLPWLDLGSTLLHSNTAQPDSNFFYPTPVLLDSTLLKLTRTQLHSAWFTPWYPTLPWLYWIVFYSTKSTLCITWWCHHTLLLYPTLTMALLASTDITHPIIVLPDCAGLYFSLFHSIMPRLHSTRLYTSLYHTQPWIYCWILLHSAPLYHSCTWFYCILSSTSAYNWFIWYCIPHSILYACTI